MSYGAITDPRLTEPGMGEFHFAHNGGSRAPPRHDRQLWRVLGRVNSMKCFLDSDRMR